MFRFMSCIAMGVVWTAITASSHAAPPAATLPPVSRIKAYRPQTYDAAARRLVARLQTIAQHHHLPGLGLAVFDRQGVEWAGGIGYADLAARRPVTARTLFHAGSITKTFVAVGLMQQVQQGRLRLDDSVHRLAPEVPLRNRWRAHAPITVAELMEHTAGLEDARPRFYFRRHYRDIAGVGLLEWLQRMHAQLHPRWRPGSRVAYSNTDYLILGYLLHKLSGQSFVGYEQQHVFGPLGIDDAALRAHPAPAEMARGYAGPRNRPLPVYWNVLQPAGALVIGPAQLAHLGVMLLDHGTWNGHAVLSPAAVARMQQPMTSAAARHGLTQGYGLALQALRLRHRVFIGHDGGVLGFLAAFMYSPALGKGYVVMVNSGAAGPAMMPLQAAIARYLAADAAPAVNLVPRPASAAMLARINGYYRSDNPRIALLAPLELLQTGHLQPTADGRLAARPVLGGKAVTLSWLGGHLWTHLGADASVFSPVQDVIFADRDGHMVISNGSSDHASRISAFAAYAPLIGAAAIGLLLLSALLFAPVWAVRGLRGRLAGRGYWSVRLPPLLCALCFVLLLVTGGRVLGDITLANSANATTWLLFASTVLFALGSVFGLVQSLRAFAWPINRWLHGHALLVSVASCAMTLALWHYGWLGLRLWAY